jgi:uncharacterized OB-fold protein
MSNHARAMARRDEGTAAWFDGLGEGRLLLRRCRSGHMSRPDVLACDLCRDTALCWAESGGTGSVVSLAVDHSGSDATVLAIVALVEGPWLLTRIDGPRVERGGDVLVQIVHPVEGEPYPVAVAAAAASV